MNDIRGLSPTERVHKLVLETSLRHSVLGQYQQPTGELTDDDLFEIFSKIEHRIYYTVDMPNFEMILVSTDGKSGKLTPKSMNCSTMQFDSKEDLVKEMLKRTEYEYFIYYNMEAVTSNNPLLPTTMKRYRIRGAFYEDPSAVRDSKIKKILGEE